MGIRCRYVHLGIRSMKITRPEDVGSLVRQRRLDLKLTQAQLAEKLDATQKYISRLEAGKPTLQLGGVLKVFRELGIDLIVDLDENIPAEKLPITEPNKGRRRRRPRINIDRLVDA
jgi:HTH-type transcriptional regulator / antitoxin HipB